MVKPLAVSPAGRARVSCTLAAGAVVLLVPTTVSVTGAPAATVVALAEMVVDSSAGAGAGTVTIRLAWLVNAPVVDCATYGITAVPVKPVAGVNVTEPAGAPTVVNVPWAVVKVV